MLLSSIFQRMYGSYLFQEKEAEKMPGNKAMTCVAGHFLKKFSGWYNQERALTMKDSAAHCHKWHSPKQVFCDPKVFVVLKSLKHFSQDDVSHYNGGIPQ